MLMGMAYISSHLYVVDSDGQDPHQDNGATVLSMQIVHNLKSVPQDRSVTVVSREL